MGNGPATLRRYGPQRQTLTPQFNDLADNLLLLGDVDQRAILGDLPSKRHSTTEKPPALSGRLWSPGPVADTIALSLGKSHGDCVEELRQSIGDVPAQVYQVQPNTALDEL
jgi:hypothetical protein